MSPCRGRPIISYHDDDDDDDEGSYGSVNFQKG